MVPSAQSGAATEERHKESAVIDDTLQSPGDVRINVTSAFITDEGSPISQRHEGVLLRDTKDIRLPYHTDFVSHVAVDIGGSLAKLVYFSPESKSRELGGRLNFLKFETDRIEQCLEYINNLKSRHRAISGAKPSDLCVIATGGGAYKYYDRMKEALDVEVLREDEMECLIIGLDFFITELPREVFSYSDAEDMKFLPTRTDIYPYLLVNIGSGVSMIKVSGPRQFVRVGGTSLGGGTLWGLLSLLTGARTFDAMLELAAKGNNNTVDMLVGDIYGTDYGKIGLRSDTIASSFGKVFKTKRQAEVDAEDGRGLANAEREDAEGFPSEVQHFAPEDISRSLLYAISYNIGQIAYLQSEKHNLPHIYFGGSYIRGHRQTMDTLSYAIRFWSQSQKQAYFLRHEGYLGSTGAFLKQQPKNWGRRNSLEAT